MKERPDLCGLPDGELLAVARLELRALVTENVADFVPLHEGLLAAGESHAGLLFTSDARFPRGRAGTIGQLVRAIEAFLEGTETHPPAPGWVAWLAGV